MKTLVTGGRGAVATAVVRGLAAAGAAVRVGGREPAAIDAPDGVEVVRVDLTDPTTMPAALAGVDRVFLYAEPAGCLGFVDAAHAAGVEQVVLLSSMAVHGSGFIADRHRVVEEALAKAEFATSVLRPGGFAGNAFGWWLPTIRAGEEVRLAVPEATEAPIDERDLGDAAAAILLAGPGAGFDGITPDVTGPASMTHREMVQTIARAMGREVPIVTITADEARAEMVRRMPEFVVDALLAHWAASDGVPALVTDEVERITGRPARTYATWAAEVAAVG